MGLEANTTVRIGRKKSSGEARLETAGIRFRGDMRLDIPFRAIRSVEAKDGRLAITHAEGVAVFELGDQAAKWADKIRIPKSRLDKLGVKAASRVAVVDVDDPDFVRELTVREATIVAAGKNLDLAFLGIESQTGLEMLAMMRQRLAPKGALWVVWPKGRPALTEDHVRRAALAIDLVDVKVAAFSATLSALKLVIPVAKR